MQFIQFTCASVAITLAALGGAPLGAQTQPGSADAVAQEQMLRKVLVAVAGQPLAGAAFQERRTSALFANPLLSRGTLSFKPNGVIEKQTTHPIRETVTIGQQTLTIDAGSGAPPQVIRLDTPGGQTASYVLGLRAALSGDDTLLRQLFETRIDGSFDNWKVTLLPKGPTARRAIRQIELRGAGGHLRQIDTTEVNGDMLEMTLTAR